MPSILPVVIAMKDSSALAFACALWGSLVLSLNASFARQAQYQLPMQAQSGAPGQYLQGPESDAAAQKYAAQQYAAQAQMQAQWAAQQQILQQQAQAERDKTIALAVAKAQRAKEPSDYELQEQAIKKGLEENKAVARNNPDYPPEAQPDTWTNNPASHSGRGSKLKGAAVTAGRMIGQTAVRALPTVGMVFLARAMNRGYSGGNYNNGYSGGYVGNPYGQYGYNPLTGQQVINPAALYQKSLMGGMYAGR